ncbi:RAD50-interacting protein 1 [Frankliniella occidentalis]|uniref:RAD50-interacting protein 1 n=1 Tax=Frankliniella occidentalis TaxID=133901 RepID=A0A9C6UC88_FRAOC|nr:RAD50-interacting protein 1 [Frankliniella occidentalis]
MKMALPNAVEKLNEELGSDIKNLKRCHEIFERVKAEKEAIEKMLSLASSEVPSRVSAAVQQVEQTSHQIARLSDEMANLVEISNKPLEEGENIISSLQDDMDKILTLERTKSYLKWLRAVEDLSCELESSLHEQADARCVHLFQQLKTMYEEVYGSQCSHFIAFLRETLLFWHTVLKSQFSKEFEEILQVIRWPFVSSNGVVTSPPPAETLSRFQILTEYLLKLQLPNEAEEVVDSALLTDTLPLSPPLQLLLRPLRRRFVFHFCRPDKETSRPDKPEWCFTQVLAWIRDHHQFVEQWVQPVMDNLSLQLSARTELIRGLVQLVAGKLHAELPTLQYDDLLFSHAVDETLSLARELRDTYGYNENTLLAVLTQASLFIRWLHLEKKLASEKMDALLSCETAWSPLGPSDLDDMKVTESIDSFLSLLQAITERYSCLPQPGHRLQFLELQLDLLDDWRVRLLQLIRVEPQDPLQSKSRVPAILNSINYLTSVLSEWGSNIHFLSLQYFQSQLNSSRETPTEKELEDTSGSVFDESLELFERMKHDLLNTICEAVLLDVKAPSRPYRKDKWFVMSSPTELVSATLTPSACPMFRVLSSHLHTLQQVLAVPLFVMAWTQIASSLSQFIYEEVILQNCFNEGGALQLQYDMTRNLFPLFGQYTAHPESYFQRVKEACSLLTMAKGSALLLQETLQECLQRESIHGQPTDDSEQSSWDVLSDLGLHTMDGQSALTILQLRTDIIRSP